MKLQIKNISVVFLYEHIKEVNKVVRFEQQTEFEGYDDDQSPAEGDRDQLTSETSSETSSWPVKPVSHFAIITHRCSCNWFLWFDCQFGVWKTCQSEASAFLLFSGDSGAHVQSVKPEVSEWVVVCRRGSLSPSICELRRCVKQPELLAIFSAASSRFEPGPSLTRPAVTRVPAPLSCTWPADADRWRTSEQQRTGKGEALCLFLTVFLSAVNHLWCVQDKPVEPSEWFPVSLHSSRWSLFNQQLS